jgi:hypothetical protein
MGEVFPKRSGKAGSKKREGDNPMSRTSKIFLRQRTGQSRPPSTITHVALLAICEKGRIDWLGTTFRRYVKMEGTKDRIHPFPQLPHYVIICAHPSSPPLIFTYVKTSEKDKP